MVLSRKNERVAGGPGAVKSDSDDTHHRPEVRTDCSVPDAGYSIAMHASRVHHLISFSGR